MTLPAYLTQYYAGLDMHAREGFFKRALDDGRCLVLLDGLDEVADEDERRQMSEWVDRLVTLYPKNRYIVTSRPPGYESAPLTNGFDVLRVRDFTEAEIRQFADNWCLAVELADQGEDTPAARRRARIEARNLVAAITANPNIRRLAVNPLLLSIVAIVHRYLATLPKRRVDLYAECVDVLLGHWDQGKGLVGMLSPREKRMVLQPIAFAMHQDKQREIARAVLERYIEKLLPDVGGQRERAKTDAVEFLDEIRLRSGLLVEVDVDTYAFSHLTFQEYLAARHLSDTGTGMAHLSSRLDDAWWQETVLLYAGMADATPVVEHLLSDTAYKDRRLLLAGLCVAEAVKLENAVRLRTVSQLEDAFATCIGDRFVQVGRVLAEIAGEDSVAFFLRVAHEDAGRRDVALGALVEMARQPNEVLREQVIAKLLENFQEKEWQHEAKRALMQLVDELYAQQTPMTLIGRVMAPMVRVPSGEFLYGEQKKRIELPEFWIDRHAGDARGIQAVYRCESGVFCALR